MVKKVKRFIVFVLFSFFYSFLMGRTAEAAGTNTVCLIPKSGTKLKYNGVVTDTDVTAVVSDVCY